MLLSWESHRAWQTPSRAEWPKKEKETKIPSGFLTLTYAATILPLSDCDHPHASRSEQAEAAPAMTNSA